MYVARLHFGEGKSAAIDTPIRISPEKSRNTCGYFSPDGKSLIFASTAGKEKPDDPTGGYQRQGRNYLWSFPTGMEIFRYDNFQEALAQAKPNSIVDLAKHPLTNNAVYDAEGSFSPDGKYLASAGHWGGGTGVKLWNPEIGKVVKVLEIPRGNLAPVEHPAAAILYLCTDAADDLVGQEMTLQDPGFRRRAGLPC